MPQRMMMRIVTNERMNMHYTIKRLYMLLAAASVSLVGCQQEDVNSGGVAQRDPNLISVSFDMSAGVQETILEETPAKQGRALGYTFEDVTVNGKTSYSVLKFDPNSSPEILEGYGIFYCPTAPEGKKIYISNGPMQWKRKSVNGSRVRYEIHTAGIVDVDRTLMTDQYQWYFAALVGAEYNASTKTFSFDPYEHATANGLKYQFNGKPISLNLPMTTNWAKLKVNGSATTGPAPWFYPEGFDFGKGQPDGIAPSVTFRPRGTVFRMRVKNESINDLRIMSYNMESNAVAFKTTISPETILGQSAEASSGGALQMTPVMNHPAKVWVYDADGSEGRIVAAKHESQSGVTLAWGYLNAEEQKKYAPNIGRRSDSGMDPSPVVPYLAVRATALPASPDKWNSMQKAADYYPIENRVSYISQTPIYYTYVNQLDKHYLDGGSEWLRVKITTSLTNLERTTFEALNANFTPGQVGSFKRGHPWMNRHADNNNYWLDAIAYPNLSKLKEWLSSTTPFKSEDKADPDLVDHSGNPLVNLTSTAKYYIPHAEEIQSYLPIPQNASSTDSLFVAKGTTKGPFLVNVIEQDLNLKHGRRAGDIASARFILKGGDSEVVNATNYGKDLKTGTSINLTGNINWSAESMKPYNYFNYYWCSHVVYGLAYLRDGDPESLVAYRYFWGISPENAGVPLGNNSVGGFVYSDAKMNAIWGPENTAILKNSSHPLIGETLRKLSAWSAGRAGVGRSMVSFFSVGMRYIGKFDPRVHSLRDIDVVANEKWWTSDLENVVFRIFTAVGFANGQSLSTGTSSVENRNRGAYILTQSNDDGAGNYDYFYIGPRSWGRFNTKNEAALSAMWLQMHADQGQYYLPNGRTPKYATSDAVYSQDERQYQISRAFLSPNSGAPTHFMVGTDPKTK